MKTIAGVATRQGVVVVADVLLLGLYALVVVRIPSWYLVAAGVGGIGLALAAWFRVSPHQWPPESRSRRVTRGVRLATLVVLGVLVLTLLARATLGSWPSRGVGVPLELWIGGVAATIAAAFSAPTANWCRDDLAERLLGSAPWVLVIAGLGALFLAVFDISSIGRGRLGRAGSLTSLLVTVSWVVVAFGDLSLLWSSIQCMVHRHDHDQVDLRRRDREAEWHDEVVSRFSADDPRE